MKKFKELVDKNGPVDIQIRDNMRMPVGTHATSWPRTISLVVYHHCDLHYENWTKVPNELKLMLENHVKVRLSLFMCIMALATNNMTSLDHFFFLITMS